MSLFGSTAPTGGFSFGAAANPTSATAGTFTFGSAPTSSAPQTGFSLGTSSAATTGFSFGNTAAATTTSGFSLGAPASAAGTSGFSFGAPVSSSGGFQLGSGSVASTAAPTFSLGQKAPAPAAATGFSLGAISQQSTLGATTASTTFNFAAKPAAAATTAPANPGFSFGSAAPTSATSTIGATAIPTLSLGGTTAVATPAPAVLAPAASTATAGFFKSGTSAALAASSISTSTTGLSALSTVTAPAKQMSYKELEDTVEKWLHDLGEQEKAFLSQAAQVNTWDKQLIENGEKVTELNNEVGRVKADQQRLDRELDFILSQQEELEELLQPIEAQVKSHQLVQHAQHSDVERERTYNLAENIDAQLKRMMEDLREIIERINSSNVNPSRGTDESMAQIGKILNSHMDSLQWVDQSTNLLQKRVEDVNQIMETRRTEHDRTFHLSYDRE